MIPAGRNSVMASRREPPDSLEFFPTPPWATRALMVHVLPSLGDVIPPIVTAWDPACGEGHMSEVLAEFVPHVRASDVFDYGRGYEVRDYLDPSSSFEPSVCLIATNPPFGPAARFAITAMAQARVVALLLRTQWNEGQDRYNEIHRDRPPTLYAPFVERVPMHKGRWEPQGSTATAYAWFVWVAGAAPRAPFHIPPGCRRALTLPDDAARFAQAAEIPLFEPPALIGAPCPCEVVA